MTKGLGVWTQTLMCSFLIVLDCPEICKLLPWNFLLCAWTKGPSNVDIQVTLQWWKEYYLGIDSWTGTIYSPRCPPCPSSFMDICLWRSSEAAALSAHLPQMAAVQKLLHQPLRHLHSRAGRSWDGNLIFSQMWGFSPVNQCTLLQV